MCEISIVTSWWGQTLPGIWCTDPKLWLTTVLLISGSCDGPMHAATIHSVFNFRSQSFLNMISNYIFRSCDYNNNYDIFSRASVFIQSLVMPYAIENLRSCDTMCNTSIPTLDSRC